MPVLRRVLLLAIFLFMYGESSSVAQETDTPLVWQLVTFDVLPGEYQTMIQLYEDEALPLYRENEAMLRFRGFREVESPVPFGLMVLTEMHGMVGMDESNNRLRAIAAEQNVSVGSLYGRISALSAGHTDEFVALIPFWKTGDPFEAKYQVFISFNVVPGKASAFELLVSKQLIPVEKELGVSTNGGTYLIADRWQYLRVFGINSLKRLGDYLQMLKSSDFAPKLDELIDDRRIVVKGILPGLSVR